MSSVFINIPDSGSESWKAPVATVGDLPSTGNQIGDARVIQGTSDIYIWTGSAWLIVAGPSMPGIQSLNGQSGAAQTMVTGTTGSDFNISSASDIHTFNLPNADATHTGKLRSADFIVFNAKQPAGNYITALTGDVTATGPGSVAATLATVNSNVGTFGTSSSVSTITVNAKGLVTAAANTGIQIVESQVTNLVSDLAAKQSTTLTNTHILVGNASNIATDVALSGDATLANTGAITLATVNSNVGSFGSSTSIPNLTVNAKGLITAAGGNVVIAPAGTLTGTTLNSTVVTSSLTSLGNQAQALNMNSHKITSLTDPTDDQDAATKFYVDAIAQGVSWKAPVIVATTANITLSGEQTIDGVLTSASRVLVKNQSTATQNGIYVSAAGAWARSTDANTGVELENASVFVQSGTTQASTAWTQTTPAPITIGVSNIAFVQFASVVPYTFRNGLLQTGNFIDVVAGDNSLTSASSSLVVKKDPAGAISTGSSGIKVNVDDSTIAISSNNIIVKTGGITNTQVNSAAAIAYSKLNLSNSIVNADINTSAAIAFSKLASLTSAHILVGNGSNVATDVAVSGDISLTNAGVTAYSGVVPLNKGGTGTVAASANAAFNALSPMTTGGDLIYGGASGAATRLGNGSAGQVLTSAGTTLAPTWATPTTGTVTSVAMTVPTFLSVSGSPITSSGTLAVTLSGTALPVANGGTGLTSGTSGGILGYTASGTLASSGALTANQLIIGGGAGVTPSTLAAGSQYQVLRMGASNPAYGSINLDQSAAVTGVLPIANGGTNNGSLSVAAGVVYYGDGSKLVGLAAGSSGQILQSNGAGAPSWVAASSGAGLVQLAKTITAASATDVTFSSISGSYTNLLIMVQCESLAAVSFDAVKVQLNADTGSNYDWVVQYAANDGSSGAAGTLATTFMTLGQVGGTSVSGNYGDIMEVKIPNYAGTVFYKHAASATTNRQSSTYATQTYVGAWKNTAAITSIKFFLNSGSGFKNGSTFTLYGMT